MNRRIAVLILGALALLVPTAHAVPTSIRIQGRLTDSGGNPIITTGPSGRIQVALFSSASGGASVWDSGGEIPVETNSAGLFAQDIGPIDSNVFLTNPTLYLELRVRDTGGLKTLSPRQKLATVPFSARAESATTAASAAFASSVADNSIGSDQIKPESINNTHLVAGAVNDVVLASGAVHTVHLASASVTDAKIVGMSAAKIVGQITDAQIVSLDSSKLTGTISTAQIGDGQVTDLKIATMSAAKLRGPLELDAISALTSLKFGGFETLKILQIVNHTVSTSFDSTSTTFINTPVSVSITPMKSNSKILVMTYGTAGTAQSAGYFTIARNGTNLGDSQGLTALIGLNPAESLFMMAYDAPNTTSAISYTAQIRCDFGAGSSYPTTALPNGATKAHIFAIEIAQ